MNTPKNEPARPDRYYTHKGCLVESKVAGIAGGGIHQSITLSVPDGAAKFAKLIGRRVKL